MHVLDFSKNGIRTNRNRNACDSIVGVTIGNFDGFHLGHQALCHALDTRLADMQKALGRQTRKTILSFHPHPRRFIAGVRRRDWARYPEYWALSPWRIRISNARSHGFDSMCIARFNRRFAQQSAEEFARRYLSEMLGANLVVVGADWCFGRERSAGVHELKLLGEKFGFEVIGIPDISVDGHRVSSGAIKRRLLEGDVTGAARFLGRYYSLSSRVIYGDQRGRTLGFPTANMDCPCVVLPQDGVYAAIVSSGGRSGHAVTNVGVRPSVDGSKRLIETHILEDGLWDSDCRNLYGKILEVSFVKRLRGELKFGSLDELKDAIAGDVKNAMLYFGQKK